MYRGAAIPALRGAYVFGDYCVGELTALVQRDGALADQALLGAETSEVTSFGEDAAGELYVLVAHGHASSASTAALDGLRALRRRRPRRGASTACGATLDRPAATLFIAPGTMTALFLARPSSPARATGSASCHRKPARSSGRTTRVAWNSVLRESGREHRHGDTPVPFSSSCTAW